MQMHKFKKAAFCNKMDANSHILEIYVPKLSEEDFTLYAIVYVTCTIYFE